MHLVQKTRAFSLVELLCLITVLSITLFSTQHELSQLHAKLQLEGFLNQSSSEIRQIQRRAQSENNTQFLEINSDHLSLSYKATSKKLKLPKLAKITTPAKLPKLYPFYPSNVNQAFSFTIENKYQRCSLIVSLRGRVRKTCAET